MDGARVNMKDVDLYVRYTAMIVALIVAQCAEVSQRAVEIRNRNRTMVPEPVTYCRIPSGTCFRRGRPPHRPK